MPERTIADLFDIPSRFQRSVHLERDLHDPHALEGYILTEPIRQALARIAAGLHAGSTLRAWRVTGDYGTGKSSFGLLLANVLGQREVPPEVRKIADLRALGFGNRRPKLHPMLVVGRREPLAAALARAISETVDTLRKGKGSNVLKRARGLVQGADVSDVAVLRALAEVRAHLAEAEPGTGVLLILDELGKLLEHCALQSDADVYLLQQLAEEAARSGEQPLVVVGLLHQGFHNYAEQLPAVARQEWEKVAGRFEEVVFDRSLEHTVKLAAGALHVRENKLPKETTKRARDAMNAAVRQGWYGSGLGVDDLASSASKLYPVHPFVLPPLVEFVHRYGQHERSLFGFLLSSEPFGLQAFACSPARADRWYRLHNLYDYVRASYGHQLGGQSYRSHWLRISSLIDGLHSEEELSLEVLKTVAILNLLDAENLLAKIDVIVGALDAKDSRTIETVIGGLKQRGLLYDRGAAGGLCLWPHTSVNLTQAYQDAEVAIEAVVEVSKRIGPHLDSRLLAARRHHIESGTLRHFDVRFHPMALMTAAQLEVPASADGLVLVPLCDTKAEHRRALEFAKAEAAANAQVLVAVPEPFTNVAADVRRFECWEWVAQNTPALNGDVYASAEVARQQREAKRKLQRAVDELVGLRGASPAAGLRWFHRGGAVPVRSGRDLIDLLSRVCAEVFHDAPRITHELLNRRSVSSAGAKARQVVIERLLDSAHVPLLGMAERGAPPEKSIYLSVLARGGLHREVGGALTIAEPPEGRDDCHLRPTFGHVHAMLTAAPNVRAAVPAIDAALRQPPYGVREGLLPLLLAVYLKAHEHELALYERGTYVPTVGGAELLRLIKAPELFEIQLCEVIGVRAEVFDRLLALLDVSMPVDRRPALLDVVTPLCVFAAGLPEFARKTLRLSDEARAVRAALVSAREPVTLLFHDLPKACGAAAFAPGDPLDDANVQGFVRALRVALDELRSSYGDLLERIAIGVCATLGADVAAREAMAGRARRIQFSVREPRLKAFCLRLADDALARDRWLEALGSAIVAKPPSRWTDGDERLFLDEVASMGETFRRVEAVAFAKGAAANGAGAVRVMLTRADGVEVARVVEASQADEAKVQEIEKKISEILGKTDGLGLVATSRAVWKALEREAQ